MATMFNCSTKCQITRQMSNNKLKAYFFIKSEVRLERNKNYC